MSTTKVVRVPTQVGQEVSAAAQILGVNSADLLEAAWASFRNSPQFKEEFYKYQTAIASGDLESVVKALDENARERAATRAAAANA